MHHWFQLKQVKELGELLEKIVAKLPSPKGALDEPLKCMLVDSWYDSYLGVIVLVRVINGQLKKNQKIRFMAAGATHTIDRVGIFSPKPTEVDTLRSWRNWFY